MSPESYSRAGLPVNKRYTGYCRSSASSDVCPITIQILLRTKCFTDSLAERSGTLVELFQVLHKEMRNNKLWLDIDSLIQFDSSLLGRKSELTDYFSGLLRLFKQPIPRVTSPTCVIFHIPHGNSVARYFDELGPDPVNDLDVIFFGTRSVVLSEIPETLGRLSLYVVVTRLSKTNSHLCFRDSQGWLSIRGRDIEEASSFRRDNISLLGYIRDLKFTNIFRFPLNCNDSIRRPRGIFPSKPAVEITQPKFSEPVNAHLASFPETRRDFSPLHPKRRILVVLWSDPEKSPWGSEQRTTVDLECDATGSDLLKTVGERLDGARDLVTGYEIAKVFPDLVQMEMISPTELINARDGDVFHIQPAIPPDQACPVVVVTESKADAHPIDFRRIRISSGQLNLSPEFTQNSFRSIVAKFVGGIDPIFDVSAAFEKSGVRSRASDGVFVLSTAICYVCIVVRYDCTVFDHLSAN
jgi:hypothetical protein